MAKDKITCLGEGQPDLKCTGNKLVSDFYPSFNKWGNGHSRYCKKCLDKIYDYYYKNSGENDKIALYYTLVQENVPFITEIYDKLSVKYGRVSINKYMTEISNRTQKQNVWIDFSSSDFKLVDNAFENQEEMKELVKKWGDQCSKAEYEFLEETFKRYTNEDDEEDLSPQRIDLIRDLCNYRLILRKINDGTYGGDMTQEKVQSQIANLLKTLKLDNFEVKKKKSDIEKLLEYRAWEIENTKPAELFDKEEYKDFFDIHKDWGKDILRCVKNLLVGSKEYPKITRDNDKY